MSTIGAFLSSLRTALLARPGLAGVRVYTGDVDPTAEAGAAIVLGSEISVRETAPTPGSLIEEEYQISLRIWLTDNGVDEDGIASVRGKALNLLADVRKTLLASPHLGGVARADIGEEWRLMQIPGPQPGTRTAWVLGSLRVRAAYDGGS